ncbi:SDR family NAD(P)-dependent oxidoreductase [Companilactobacillus mishanensis]|uniref:SDR family NAD(P)-dependent oxidoreductase n=1 Tax=Companilactobacillus mishanensis TaxID=2486008 RepID=A0A5P0ZJF2_9LACO|nr:SDR family NAD(P)-dependent oxidoreductase [Companilactobacillus mishanensis]MQS53168.1 SDR family NAD(P)-dependent oxidoreductase [Companilactobacillus mishanensis]
MTKIFITGSTDGLGLLASKKLIEQGNEVVLHARNQKRADDVHQELPDQKVLIGDLAVQSEVENLAKQVNDEGPFDTIINNAGVYTSDTKMIFHVNVLAPYILTSLIKKPKRVIYVSSGMHEGSKLDMDDLEADTSYSSSKLQVLMLTKAVARLWPDVAANAVDPGWVPTKMGGSEANDDLKQGYSSQVWLATFDDLSVTGKYFYHMSPNTYDERADNVELQDELLQQLKLFSGIDFPD